MRTLGLVGPGIVVILLIALFCRAAVCAGAAAGRHGGSGSPGRRRQPLCRPSLGSDILSVHYKEAGDPGRSLVLLHGFGASLFRGGKSWRRSRHPTRSLHSTGLRSGLTGTAASRDVGHGLRLGIRRSLQRAAQADLTIALLDERRIDKAVLVGNSAGGAIAMLVALEHPERAEALVLISPAVYNGGANWAARLLLNTPQMQHIGPLIARRIQEWGMISPAAWADPERITGARCGRISGAAPDPGLGSLAVGADCGKSPAWPGGPPGGTGVAGALVITGDDDRIVPTDQSVRLAGALPNAELAVIPACGHVAHEEVPRRRSSR